jgi:cell division transport system permease protein
MKPSHKPNSGASQRKAKVSQRATSLWQNHIQNAQESLNRLLNARVASAMTIAVIGISLLLPAGLFVTMKNLQALGNGFNQLSPITLYLNDNVTEKEGISISERLLTQTDATSTQYVSKQQAAADFAIYSGLGDVISELEDNPLPASIVLTPKSIEGEISRELVDRLSALPEVESVQVDLDWIARLQEFLRIASRAANALMLVFSCAVLFIVGNTIKMSIEGRRAEIVVVKLVGGTDSYVARPFLYTGLWLGLAGGLLAWILLYLILLALYGPVDRLLALYDSQYELGGLGLIASLVLLISSAGLGWLGAWVSVRQHLAAIEPR